MPCFGSAEGILKRITTDSGHSYLRLFDLLTGKSMVFYFEKSLLPELPKLEGKRVLASGKFYLNRAGEKICIRASEIKLMPDELSLPTINEMIGIIE